MKIIFFCVIIFDVGRIFTNFADCFIKCEIKDENHDKTIFIAKGLPKWPAFSPETEATMRFDASKCVVLFKK